MDDKRLIEMIDLYLDGELKKDQELFLFTRLAADDEAREYFNQLNSIKAAIPGSAEEFPEDLDERILGTISSENSSHRFHFSNNKLLLAVSLAASVVLLLFSGYLFLRIDSYHEKVNDLSQQVKLQSQTIEMLYNSLPGIEVESSLKNAIIIKPNS
jgi:hypothetical protein